MLYLQEEEGRAKVWLGLGLGLAVIVVLIPCLTCLPCWCSARRLGTSSAASAAAWRRVASGMVGLPGHTNHDPVAHR